MSDKQDWIDELYAEGAEEGPPPELDEKIRAAARAPVQHPWYRNPGRLAMLATAASLVIAVSVIYFEPEQAFLDDPEPVPQAMERAEPKQSAADFEALPEVERAENGVRAAKAVPAPAASPPRSEPVAERQAADPTGRAMRMLERDQAAAQIEEIAVTGFPVGSTLADQDIAEELVQLCGALPGTAETREISSDESGWLVTVSIGEDVRTWRCVDGAWIETTASAASEEQ